MQVCGYLWPLHGPAAHCCRGQAAMGKHCRGHQPGRREARPPSPAASVTAPPGLPPALWGTWAPTQAHLFCPGGSVRGPASTPASAHRVLGAGQETSLPHQERGPARGRSRWGPRGTRTPPQGPQSPPPSPGDTWGKHRPSCPSYLCQKRPQRHRVGAPLSPTRCRRPQLCWEPAQGLTTYAGPWPLGVLPTASPVGSVPGGERVNFHAK